MINNNSEGLRARIQVLIPDQSGKLKAIIAILDNMKASVHDIEHERSTTSVPVGHVKVTVTFNLQDTTQLSMICKELEKGGMQYEVLR